VNASTLAIFQNVRLLASHKYKSIAFRSILGKGVALGYPVTAIRDTPDFDHLRGNQRLQALLTKL